MRYELFYWPMLQGRGEFVRLALEEAGAAYIDVARQKDGMAAMDGLLEGAPGVDALPFAPPFLRAGTEIISQTANILAFLGPRLSLVPEDESLRRTINGLQLTIADLVAEVHDTHHPIASSAYYEDQKPEARARAKDFIENRLPKFLGYFEKVLERNGISSAMDSGTGHSAAGNFLAGKQLSYVDLSLFQVVEGLRYAFPRAMKQAEKKVPRVIALRDQVAARPTLRRYLDSDRRIPFNEQGIFRHYPELDS